MPTAPPPEYGRVTPTELSCYRLASTVACWPVRADRPGSTRPGHSRRPVMAVATQKAVGGPVSGRSSGAWSAECRCQNFRHWASGSASAIAFGRPWRVLPCGLVESTSAAVKMAAAPVSAKWLSSGACHWLSSGPALIGTRPDSFVFFMPAPASQRPAPRPHRALQDAEVSEAGSCRHRGPTTGARRVAAAGGSRAHRPAPAAPPGSPQLPVAAPAAPG